MLHSYNSSGIFVCAVSRRPLRLKGLTATDKILWNSLAFFLPAVPLWPRPTQTKNLYETGCLRERDFHSTINNITFIKLIICLFPLHSLLENVTQPIKSLLTSARLYFAQLVLRINYAYKNVLACWLSISRGLEGTY